MALKMDGHHLVCVSDRGIQLDTYDWFMEVPDVESLLFMSFHYIEDRCGHCLQGWLRDAL